MNDLQSFYTRRLFFTFDNNNKMSQWRRIANERLPELRGIIDSDLVDSPMMLWIELNIKFDDLCKDEIPNMDLIKRIWSYCEWCLQHRSGDVMTAAALAFCEHLIDNKTRASILPRIMTRSDYVGFREILLYHNDEERFLDYMKSLWPV